MLSKGVTSVGCTILCGVCCGCAFAALLFVIPLVIDPALADLKAEFNPENATCLVIEASVGVGTDECRWSSCSEGCTRDLYTCFRIRVSYFYYYKKDYPSSTGILFVNAKACGYPPEVQCERFFERHYYAMTRNRTFPCFVSRNNASVVVTQFDDAYQRRKIVLASTIPSVILVTSSFSILCIRKYLREEKEDMEGEETEVTRKERVDIIESESDSLTSNQGQLDQFLRNMNSVTSDDNNQQRQSKRKWNQMEMRPTLSKRIRYVT